MGLVVDLAGQHPKLPPENWVIVQSRVWLTDCQSLLKGKEWTPTRAPAISLLVKLAGALHHYPPTPENIDNSSQCQYPKERLPVGVTCWHFLHGTIRKPDQVQNTMRTFWWGKKRLGLSLWRWRSKKKLKDSNSKTIVHEKSIGNLRIDQQVVDINWHLYWQHRGRIAHIW